MYKYFQLYFEYRFTFRVQSIFIRRWTGFRHPPSWNIIVKKEKKVARYWIIERAPPFLLLRIFVLPRLVQFRGEKQALREERGDTAAFFFLLSRVVSPLTDGDRKSDRGEIAGKNYQARETLVRARHTRSNRVTDGIRRGKEKRRKEKRMGT